MFQHLSHEKTSEDCRRWHRRFKPLCSSRSVGHLVLCTCSWSRAFIKGDPGQKNERDSWYLTRGKFLCLTLTFGNLALRGIPPFWSCWLCLVSLWSIDTTQDSTVQPVNSQVRPSLQGTYSTVQPVNSQVRPSLQGSECKVPWCSRLKGC